MSDYEWSDIKHFKPSEFACRCGTCGSTGYEMDLYFVNKLDQIRERCGFPLVVTSGYRCPSWNTQVSTTGRDGPHTTGKAADVLVHGSNAHRLVQQCSLGGWFSGIGLNQKGDINSRYIHLDILTAPDHPRPWIWTY